jgi:hypothetical protein
MLQGMGNGSFSERLSRPSAPSAPLAGAVRLLSQATGRPPGRLPAGIAPSVTRDRSSPSRQPAPGPLQPGDDPSQFRLARGESAIVRVIGIGIAQLETVGRTLEKLEGDGEPGNRYRYTADGAPGQVQHALLRFEFPRRLSPPARYAIWVEGAGGSPRAEAPSVFQPALGAFPQTVCYALSFRIT